MKIIKIIFKTIGIFLFSFIFAFFSTSIISAFSFFLNDFLIMILDNNSHDHYYLNDALCKREYSEHRDPDFTGALNLIIQTIIYSLILFFIIFISFFNLANKITKKHIILINSFILFVIFSFELKYHNDFFYDGIDFCNEFIYNDNKKDLPE